MKDSSTICT